MKDTWNIFKLNLKPPLSARRAPFPMGWEKGKYKISRISLLPFMGEMSHRDRGGAKGDAFIPLAKVIYQK